MISGKESGLPDQSGADYGDQSMTTDRLFKLLGGRENVMQITGASRQATGHWIAWGVPYRHWPALRAAARVAGLRLTDAALLSTRRRRKA